MKTYVIVFDGEPKTVLRAKDDAHAARRMASLLGPIDEHCAVRLATIPERAAWWHAAVAWGELHVINSLPARLA